MTPFLHPAASRRLSASLLLLAGILSVLPAAETARPAAASSPRAATAARTTTGGRNVLPDPILLDGSTHAAEKKSEYGMIGDFELPGDENARNGKVGGKSGGEEAQPPADAQPGGGGGTGSSSGKPGPGGGPAGQQPPAGGGAGEPDAKAEGIKVAELGGDPSGKPADGAANKPGPVAIGDKAMRIPPSAQTASGVVGAQQVANQNTQVYEKATGSGGKAPTGQQGPSRTEKGRTIPAGL